MTLFLLSIVALAVGPTIVSLAGTRSWLLSLVDGFVIVTIGGIALIHILPPALLSCGAWAFAGAALGLFAPMLLERTDHAHHDDVLGGDRGPHKPALVLALVGIAMHAFLDGSAFVDQGEHAHAHGSAELLGVAVVLHRIPEGLAIWWLSRARRGKTKLAVLALAMVAVATALGARFGDAIAHGAHAALFSFFQAVVAGSLLHVLLHHGPPADARGAQVVAALGALGGTALLVVVSASHPTARRVASEIAMGPAFVTLALESAPALIVAYVGSGLAHAFLPPGVFGRLSRSPSLRGLFTGPPFPGRSCGGPPIDRSTIARGAPRLAALALLVAAPEIGLSTLLLSWSLLGGSLTIVRGLAAMITALAVGFALTRVGSSAPRVDGTDDVAVEDAPAPAPRADASIRSRLWSALRYGLGDMVDRTMPWIMIGVAVASFAEPLLDGGPIALVSPWVDVPVFAAIGVPMYVCASGATPLVAVLLHKGVSPGAAIAFLLTGPATNLTTFGVLASARGKRLAVWFAATMLVVPTLIGWGVNLALPRQPPALFHTSAREPASAVQIVSLAILALLVGISLLRHGPRHMVARLAPTDAHSR